MKLTPQRFNSLVGAARSGQAAGDRKKAAAYYTKLLANCSSPDAARAELREARLFLNRE